MTTTTEQATIPVLVMDHADDPDGVLELWTPSEVTLLRAMRDMSDDEVSGLGRLIDAMQAGEWTHTADEIRTWTPDRCRAELARGP
jgi:hypothetical protein